MFGLFNGSVGNEIFDIDTYCPKCGGTGFDPITQERCTCANALHLSISGISCLDIPKQYAGKSFNPKLVPKDCGDIYVSYMTKLHEDLITQKLIHYNGLICSPIAHSKSVLAYSVIETLYRKNVPTFPVMTTAEIRGVMSNIDSGIDTVIGTSTSASNFVLAPYVFIKIPILIEWSTFPVIMEIMDRRVRRGLSTLFFYDGDYETLVKLDRQNIIGQLSGDGSYMTLDVHKFYRLSESGVIDKFNKEIREFRI